MATAINIKECIRDEDSYFNIKRFKLLGFSVDKPLKIWDLKGSNFISKNIFQSYVQKSQDIICEASKVLKKPDVIFDIVNSEDNSQINKHFQTSEWKPNLIIPQTFQFNPYESFENLKILESYLNYYYEHSDVLFVPNIRTNRTKKIQNPENTEKQKTVTEKIIDYESYVKFVDEIVQILNYRNNKPIFVPLSLRFSIQDIGNLAENYLKKEYFNIWVDFEAQNLSKAQRGKLKAFLMKIEASGRFDDVIIYTSNMRRSISENSKNPKSQSSDPISSVLGSNIIGGNRNPPVYIPPDKTPANGERIPADQLPDYKASIFDRDSYYYINSSISHESTEIKELLKYKHHNTLINSIRINDEFRVQTDKFLENYDLKGHISEKTMLKDDPTITSQIFEQKSKFKETSLLDFL
jgi:hypothetical protein